MLLRLLISLTFALFFLFPAYSQHNPPSVTPSPEQQAVHFVAIHYAIDPTASVPATGKPIASGGAWTVQKIDSCSTTTDSCFLVRYKTPPDISCEWTIAPNGAVINMNENAAHYLSQKDRGDPPGLISVSKQAPVYPDIAKRQRVMGTVKMLAHISATGQVDQVTVISGPSLLQKSAKDAVQQWRYKPVVINSSAVPVQTLVEIHFQVQ